MVAGQKEQAQSKFKKEGEKKKRKSKVWSEFLARLLRSGGFREKIKSDKERKERKSQNEKPKPRGSKIEVNFKPCTHSGGIL